MLAKQGWRLVQDQESLLSSCFKACYFPRCSFLEATDSPNCSFTWKSILAAKPLIQRGSCWRVGNGTSIRALTDAWIPNYPTNKVLHPALDVEEDCMVADLIDPDTGWWDREFVMQHFNREDGEAILRVPLSRRVINDALFWTFTKSGDYTVRSRYHVARQVQKEANWAVFQRSGGRCCLEGSVEAESAKQNQSIWLVRLSQYTAHPGKFGAQKDNIG